MLDPSKLTTPLIKPRTHYANAQSGTGPSICLIRPKAVFSARAYSTPLGMPLGIAYLASTLVTAGYRVQTIDALGMGIEQFRVSEDGAFKFQGISDEKVVSSIHPDTDIIGISIMFSQEWPFLRDLIRKIRRAFPRATLVLGGEHATALTEYCLTDRPEINFIVKGEGELTLLALVFSLRNGLDPYGIAGVAGNENGVYRENQLSPRVTDLNSMPWPAWELFDLNPYFRPNYTMGISHGRNMAMLATRGCPYRCTFCSNPGMWTTRYVLRPVADVVAEMEYYVRKYHTTMIEFYDLTAIVNRRWILEFCHEIERRSLKINWQLPAGTRSEVLDDEVLAAISKAGLKYLAYAPESGSPRILKAIKKQVNLPNLKKSMDSARRHGLAIKTNIIIGFPDETRWDVFKTLVLVWHLALKGIEDCNISPFSPYPGSELYNELRSKNEIEEPSDSYFMKLISQFDFTRPKSFCRNIPPLELMLYRFFGMSLFYLLGFPRRINSCLHLAQSVWKKSKDFLPETIFEQRILDWVARRA